MYFEPLSLQLHSQSRLWIHRSCLPILPPSILRILPLAAVVVVHLVYSAHSPRSGQTYYHSSSQLDLVRMILVVGALVTHVGRSTLAIHSNQ